MKSSRRQTIGLGVVALCLAFGSAGAHAQTSGFNFRFSFGCGAPDTLDTFNRTFTRRAGDGSQRVTIPLTLSDQQMRAIADAVDQIRFFDYPQHFSGWDPTSKENITVSPSNKWRLEVRVGDRVNTVEWDDANRPYSREATNLTWVFGTIIRYVSDRPEVQRLPVQNSCY